MYKEIRQKISWNKRHFCLINDVMIKSLKLLERIFLSDNSFSSIMTVLKSEVKSPGCVDLKLSRPSCLNKVQIKQKQHLNVKLSGLNK